MGQARQLPDREHGGDCLGDDRGPGHASDAHAEAGDKQPVQDDVQRRGHQQIDQRGNAVPQAAEHAAQDVIKAAARDAQEDDDQIGGTPVDDALRRIQQAEQGPGEQRPDHHDDHGGEGGQNDAGPDRTGQFLPLRGPKILAHQDAGSHGDAHEQHQHQIQDRPRTAHGGQGVVSDVASHDDAVHRVVQLLGDIPQEHRNRKGNDLLYGRPHAHIHRRE